jgi:hypothetical protein
VKSHREDRGFRGARLLQPSTATRRPYRGARTRLKDGGAEDLAGVSLLRFSADGLVIEERDFWAEG